jgi:hypothetical protein
MRNSECCFLHVYPNNRELFGITLSLLIPAFKRAGEYFSNTLDSMLSESELIYLSCPNTVQQGGPKVRAPLQYAAAAAHRRPDRCCETFLTLAGDNGKVYI